MGNRHGTEKRKAAAQTAADNDVTSAEANRKQIVGGDEPETKKRRKKRSRNKATDVVAPTESTSGVTSSQHPGVITTMTLTTGDDDGEDVENRKQLELTIYRSYSGNGGSNNVVAATHGGGEPTLEDVKLYRKNKDGGLVGAAAAVAGSRSSSASLGRKDGGSVGGKRRSSKSPARHSSTVAASTARDYPELVRRQLRWDSFSDTRSSARASLTNSPAATAGGYKVTAVDFPPTEMIKSRVLQFEENFVTSLLAKFTSLPVRVQLASVCVAIRQQPETVSTETPPPISLATYLHMTSLQVANIDSRRDYVIVVPEAVLRDMAAARKQIKEGAAAAETGSGNDNSVGASLARDAVTSAARLAADEITRVFEYQIALLEGNTSGRMLADHAACCVMDYVINGRARLMDRNTILRGVFYGRPKSSGTKFVSVIVGQRELKWNIREILTRPGLRRESLLFPPPDSDTPSSTPCFRNGSTRPWTFHSAPGLRSDPLHYGYRGLALEWDFSRGGYVVEEGTGLNPFNVLEEMTSRSEDFHKLYCPYRRLVGTDVMRKHLNKFRSSPEAEQESFVDLIRQLHGLAYNRDDIQPVYRPLVTDEPLQQQLLTAQPHNRQLVTDEPPEDEHIVSTELYPDGIAICVTTEDNNAEISSIAVELDTTDAEISAVTSTAPGDGSSLLAPPENLEQASGSRSSTPSSLGSTRLMTMIAESGGNVRRLMKDIKQRVKHRNGRLKSKRLAANKNDNTANNSSVEQKIEEQKQESSGNDVTMTSQENEVNRKENDVTLTPNNPTVLTIDQKEKTNTTTVTECLVHSPEGDTNLRVDSPGGAVTRRVLHSLEGDTECLAVSYSGLTQSAVRPTLLPTSESTPKDDLRRHVTNDVTFAGNRSAPTTMLAPTGNTNDDVRRAATLAWNMKPEVEPDSRRGRVLQALNALQVSELVSNLPTESTSSPLIGRNTEVLELCDLLSPSSDSRNPPGLVIITGCHGIGKSALAMAVGRTLLRQGTVARAADVTAAAAGDSGTSDADVDGTNNATVVAAAETDPTAIIAAAAAAAGYTAVTVVDCRGCDGTRDSLASRLLAVFGLRHRQRTENGDLRWFCYWLSCRDRPLLIVLDNLDTSAHQDDELSSLADLLLTSVSGLRLLVTGRRSFYRGSVTSHRTYRLHDLRDSADSLFLQVTPDLSDDDIRHLGALCHYLPYSIHLVAAALSLDTVDTEGLLEALSAAVAHPAISAIEADICRLVSGVEQEEVEARQLRAVAVCVLALLDCVGEVYTEILCRACTYANTFSFSEVANQLRVELRHSAPAAFDNLTRLGLLQSVTGAELTTCVMPTAVRIVARHLMVDVDTVEQTYLSTQLSRLLDLSRCFYTGQSQLVHSHLPSVPHPPTDDHSQLVLNALRADRDNLSDVIRRASVAIATGNASEADTYILWSFASVEGASFLDEFLPEDAYQGLFDALQQTANDDSALLCRALCGAAYRDVVRGRVGRAAVLTARAYELLPSVGDAERAFCLLCLAGIYSGQDTNKALALARRSLDSYREVSPPSASQLGVLYSAQLLSTLLADSGNVQSALNVCRLADDAGLQSLELGHPLIVSGFELRRRLWTAVGLLERARQAALKASDAALRYYGADHPAMGTALANLCEAISARGSIDDAICVGIHALAVRIKVLGDHVDTAKSYQMLSELMLRRRLCDAAVAFAQRAVDVLRRVGADTADAGLIVARAVYRTQRSSSLLQASPNTPTDNFLPSRLDFSCVIAESRDSCRKNVSFNEQSSFTAAVVCSPPALVTIGQL